MEQITQAEYDEILRLKGLISYDQNQVAGLINLVRKFVNSNMSFCAGCSSSISQAKGMLYEWFNLNQEALLKQLNEPQTLQDLNEQVQTDVVEIKPRTLRIVKRKKKTRNKSKR